MEKRKIIKLISLGLDLFVFVAVSFVIIKAVFFGYKFGDITVPPYEFSYFRYFTNLSNILAGVVGLILFIYTLIHFKDDNPLPRWLTYLSLASSTGVGLTFITVLFFLGPTFAMNGSNYFVMFMDDLLFTHFLNPVVSCVTFAFFLKHERVNYKQALFGVIPMAVYACIYSPCVLSGVWDDFYGFTFGGNWWVIFLALPIMLCVTYLISFVLSIATRRGQK